MADDNPQGGDSTAIQTLLDKHKGDAMSLALQLFGENFQLREKNRTLKEKIPAEGFVVVAKADADSLTTYQALGKPDELKTRLDAHTTLETELATTKRAVNIRRVAELAGYDASVLEAIAGDADFFTKEVEDGGKKIEKPFVKVKENSADVEKPLTEHAESAWQKFMPSLKVGGQQKGTGFVPMNAGGKAASDNVFDKIRANAKAEQDKKGQAGDPLKERFGLAKTA